VIRRALSTAPLLALVLVLAGCAAGMALRRGNDAARRGDWDAAVVHYREALQADPDRPEFKIALERAMSEASRIHLRAAHEAEARGELDAAVREYRRAAEYDASNRQAAAKVVELDQTIRDRIEAARPKPPIDRMRERARQMAAEPKLSATQPIPLIRFTNQSVREILNFIGSSAGINVVFAQDYQDRAFTVHLDDVTLEQALQHVLSANQLFYKVLNERTILVIPESQQNHARYDEQVVKTFYLSHADAIEVAQMLNLVLRVPGLAIIPTIAPNKTRNTITVRGTAALVAIMERVVESNDRPPAEVVLDVTILEVNRDRVKEFGLDLGSYSISALFSPEGPPTSGTGGVTVPPYSISSLRGASSDNIFLTIPQAVVRFLESDTQTKLVAKPQLRGQEGHEIKLNLGDRIPTLQTTFGSIGGPGSVATQPISSYTYEDIGVNVTVTPRVTLEGDVVLTLNVENSTLGAAIPVGGQTAPVFGNRSIETRIRLRDGESTMLAGLLRQDSTESTTGIIGLMRLPVFRQLFSNNDHESSQTDIVMLITPHIVRTQELRQQDIDPLYIGTQQNLGIGGPPPLIAPQPTGLPAAQTPSPANEQPGPGQEVRPGVMPGTLPQPGVMPLPQPAPSQPAPTEPAEPQPPENQGAPQGSEAAQPAVVPPRDQTGGATGATVAGAPGAAGTSASGGGIAQVTISAPGTEFRVGGGPYTVPLSISGASRLSTLSLSVTFNAAALRVRAVQEGSFMRQGGVNASFTQQVDAASGRIDMTLTRSQDLIGATGSGLLAAVLFEPVAAGASTLAVSGAGSGPAGSVVTVQSTPVTITVR
jgi:general secretion pathway protein D